jgi:hypothetical protein
MLIDMGKEPKNSICTYPSTLVELLDDMELYPNRYKHLQIILKHDNNGIRLGLGQEYLVVNKIGFGIYQLNNVDYSGGVILMTLTNTTNDKRAEITLDINNKHPEHFLICWNDIKEMILKTNEPIVDNDSLLEFDF